MSDDDQSFLGEPTEDLDFVGEDLRRVGKKLGRSPTYTDYEEHGECSTASIYYRWDGWEEAVRAVGFRKYNGRKDVDAEAIHEDLRRVAIKLLKRPNSEEYERNGNHSRRTAYKYCGETWDDILDGAFPEGIETFLEDKLGHSIETERTERQLHDGKRHKREV